MTLLRTACIPLLSVCTKYIIVSTHSPTILSLQYTVTKLMPPLLEKHTLKYHLAHWAYLQAKTVEMNIVSQSGCEGHARSVQMTLNLTPGLTQLGINNPTEQYRTFMPFSSINDSNGYNNSVLS